MRSFLTPSASHSLAKSTRCALSPWMSRPVPGLSWPPVMPTARLSSSSTVTLPRFQVMSSRPCMPMCMKVESPITAITAFLASAGPRPLSMPSATPIEAPIEMQVSSAFQGWPAPRV